MDWELEEWAGGQMYGKLEGVIMKAMVIARGGSGDESVVQELRTGTTGMDKYQSSR